MSDKLDKDDVTGVETTGHEWDGIKELNNPLPRWWVWVWLLTIVWSIGYYFVYPSWPTLSGYLQGSADWSSRGEVAKELDQLRQMQAQYRTAMEGKTLAEIKADASLMDFAYRGGQSAFGLFCSQCHGRGAEGAVGIANLNDDYWIWGGTLEEIQTTIQHGVRDENDFDSRYAMMPAFVKDGILDQAQAKEVASYVMAMSDRSIRASQEGATLYQEQCATCHGERGEGLKEMGGPRLNDAIWLYQGGVEAVYQQIVSPKHGMMPAWGSRLDPVTIKQLAIYVHSLGGGEN